MKSSPQVLGFVSLSRYSVSKRTKNSHMVIHLNSFSHKTLPLIHWMCKYCTCTRAANALAGSPGFTVCYSFDFYSFALRARVVPVRLFCQSNLCFCKGHGSDDDEKKEVTTRRLNWGDFQLFLRTLNIEKCWFTFEYFIWVWYLLYQNYRQKTCISNTAHWIQNCYVQCKTAMSKNKTKLVTKFSPGAPFA